jgi:transposase
MLSHVEALEADIDVLSQRIAELVEPWAGHLAILDSITGVGPRAAEVILAEIGPDMTRFPTAGHLASWAGRCPGQRESAGRRGSAKPRKGSPWLADVLTQCAWAAVKTKDTYLSAYAWHLLSNGALYDDPGAAAVRRSSDEQQRRRAIRQLEALGLKVTVEPREGDAAP